MPKDFPHCFHSSAAVLEFGCAPVECLESIHAACKALTSLSPLKCENEKLGELIEKDLREIRDGMNVLSAKVSELETERLNEQDIPMNPEDRLAAENDIAQLYEAVASHRRTATLRIVGTQFCAAYVAPWSRKDELLIRIGHRVQDRDLTPVRIECRSTNVLPAECPGVCRAVARPVVCFSDRGGNGMHIEELCEQLRKQKVQFRSNVEYASGTASKKLQLPSTENRDPRLAVGPLNWAPDAENCFVCQKQFQGSVHREWCRQCGQCVCNDCSKGRLKVGAIFDLDPTPQRVCDRCYRAITAGHLHVDQSTLASYPSGARFWATEPDAEMEIRLAERGVGAEPPETVLSLLARAARCWPLEEALRVEREGRWVAWTWRQYSDEVMAAAKAFIVLGLKPFHGVNIIGFNSPEWVISNVGAIAAGGIAAGIYTTSEAPACEYIAKHSRAAVVVVENKAHLDKFLMVIDRLPELKALVVYGEEPPRNSRCRVPLYSFCEFMQLGRNADQETEVELKKRMEAQRPGHCCTLIYTSGTTGHPKAVMISHDNISWTVKSFLTTLPSAGKYPERVVSYLPLNHIAAQMLDIWAPISMTGLGSYATVWFARPTALKGTLTLTLADARPTFFFGVPRVFEKMEEKMREVGAQGSALKKKIAAFIKRQGAKKNAAEAFHSFQQYQAIAKGGVPEPHKSLKFRLASKLLKKIKRKLGLDQARVCFTGAAPIMRETLNYFASLDIPICELYGMSECTGPETTCTFQLRMPGSCGIPIPGTELMIDHQEGRDKEGEGEICYRGRHIMMGYMGDPEKTREAIDENGFLHSGDVGRVDEHGFLYITGRIKELIIGAGGENIAPVPVEDCIKRELPAVSNAMMVGDKRKYNVVLLTLKTAVDEKTSEPTNQLTGEALKVSPQSKTVEEAQKDAAWRLYIEKGLERANAQATSNATRVQKFRILNLDFSIAGGELTPTMKLKRQVVQEKYSGVIEEMYAEN